VTASAVRHGGVTLFTGGGSLVNSCFLEQGDVRQDPSALQVQGEVRELPLVVSASNLLIATAATGGPVSSTQSLKLFFPGSANFI
jgi:hypothetical protein